MAAVNPRQIPGRWREGFALDLHTTASVFLGHDEYGRAQFDTTRSEVGELLYRLKYSNDQTVVAELADAAANFIRQRAQQLDVIATVPPSRQRQVQPVHLLAAEIGRLLRLPFDQGLVTRVTQGPELKGIFDYNERAEALAGAYAAASTARGRAILLFDDLYRSGASMNAVAESLYGQGARDVVALALTQTRSNR